MIKLGRYKHFKGKEYKVIGVARDCEDPNKEIVIYRALYKSDKFKLGQLWTRELSDFVGEKIIFGRSVKRFEFIGD